ncbi:branched-chain amino acid ABC transporter permease [Halorientalis salina]|uniref:branched-chain amino acid ABC transporter permease n=1 Tax=Halorientalis salina TaxID=2932266 RepID=UPI0010ACFF0C|nr:branched-chain amino acid ABC transporter permease [Halorientalis salina]
MSNSDLSERLDVEGGTFRQWLNPLNKPLRHKIGLLVLLLLAVLPVALTSSEALIFASAFFFAMFAMSWDLVSGYTGQISFGHTVFFTVGGYSAALLNMEMGLSPLMTIPAGVLVAALAGLVIGVPTLRLRGPYLSLVTLIAPLILFGVFRYFPIFGGESGLSGEIDNLFGLGFNDVIPVYYLAFGLFVVVLTVLLAVTRSDAGRIFTAIRESEDAVNSAGLNPAKFKIFAFVLSAAIGGLAGAAFVHTPSASPTPNTLLALAINIEIIIAVFIGGAGTIVGAAAGGLFFGLTRSFLEGSELVIPVANVAIAEVYLILLSVIALVIIYALPGGLLRGSIVGGRRVLNRNSDEDVATDGGEMVNPVAQILNNYRDFLGGDDDER